MQTHDVISLVCSAIYITYLVVDIVRRRKNHR